MFVSGGDWPRIQPELRAALMRLAPGHTDPPRWLDGPVLDGLASLADQAPFPASRPGTPAPEPADILADIPFSQLPGRRMRFLLTLAVIANLGLLAYGQGFFGPAAKTGRKYRRGAHPGRCRNATSRS